MDDQHDLDWNKVEERYSGLKSTLEAMKPPLPSEIDEYKAAASTNRELNTTLAAKFNYGYNYYPGNSSYRRQIEDFNEEVRTGGRFDLAGVRSSYEVVEEAIRSKVISGEFLSAWAHLHVLLGRRYELQENQDLAEVQFRRVVRAGASQQVALQQAWYAAWVLFAAKNSGQRREVEFDLAQLCCDIWRGVKSAPNGFPVEWFEKLICQENGARVPKTGAHAVVDLKGSFTKLGWRKLEELAGKFPHEKLPPLSASAFEDQIRSP